MRYLLILVFTFNLIFPPSLAVSGEIMDGAKKSVEQSLVNADKYAKYLVNQDYNDTLAKVSHKINSVYMSSSVIKAAMEANQSLESEVVNFAMAMEKKRLVESSQELRALIDKLAELRLRYLDLSFVPSEVAIQYRTASPIMNEISQSFAYTCSVGRSSKDFSVDPDVAAELPALSYSYNVSIGQPDTYIGLRANQEHYRNENQTRSAIMTGSSIAFSVSSTILISAYGSALLNGTAVAGGVAMKASAMVCPAAAAILLVAMAIEYFAAQEAAHRLQLERAQGEVYKFKNQPRDQYVAGKYREYCGERQADLQEIFGVLAQIESGKGLASEIAHMKSEAGQKELQEEINENNRMSQAQCRLQLEQDNTNGLCGKEVDGRYLCKEDKGVIKGAACEIKVGADKKSSTHAEDEKIIANTKLNSKLMLKKLLIQSLAINKEVFFGDNSVNMRNTAVQLERAEGQLSQLLSFSNQVRQNRLDSPSRLIEEELAVDKEFQALRLELLNLGDKAVRVVFKKIDPKQYEVALKNFKARFVNFYNSYKHIDKVQGMRKAYEALNSGFTI